MNKIKEVTAEQLADAKRLNAIYKAKKRALGITQQAIGDALEISQGAVGHYLNGRNALNARAASVFAFFLQVPVNDFSPTLASLIAKQAASITSDSGCDDSGSFQVRDANNLRRLTDEQIELIETFDALPDDKKEKFMREMKAMKAHYDAYFEQRLRESHGKAS